jgi:hypothetical protein
LDIGFWFPLWYWVIIQYGLTTKRKLIDIGFYSTLFKGFGIQFFSGRFSGLLDG